MISQNVKDAIETAIMNIIDDVIKRSSVGRSESSKTLPIIGKVLGPTLEDQKSFTAKKLGEDFLFRIRCFPTLSFR